MRAEIQPHRYGEFYAILIILGGKLAQACSREHCQGGVSDARDPRDCFSFAQEAKAHLESLHLGFVEACSESLNRDDLQRRFCREMDIQFKDVPMPVEAGIQL